MVTESAGAGVSHWSVRPVCGVRQTGVRVGGAGRVVSARRCRLTRQCADRAGSAPVRTRMWPRRLVAPHTATAFRRGRRVPRESADPPPGTRPPRSARTESDQVRVARGAAVTSERRCRRRRRPAGQSPPSARPVRRCGVWLPGAVPVAHGIRPVIVSDVRSERERCVPASVPVQRVFQSPSQQLSMIAMSQVWSSASMEP